MRKAFLAGLASASRCQDHTTSPSALTPPVWRRQASTASRAQRHVTVAKRPLFEGRGTGRASKGDLPDGESGNFKSDVLDFWGDSDAASIRPLDRNPTQDGISKASLACARIAC